MTLSSQPIPLVQRFFARCCLSTTVVLAAMIEAHGFGAAGPVYPVAIAVDKAGVIYLADRDLPGVWRWEGERLSVLFQGSKQFRTPLNAIRCLALDREGRLLAGDSATCDVYRFDEQGRPHPLTAQGKPYGQIGIPMAIAVDAAGNVLVSDLELHRIVRVAKTGGTAEPFAAVSAPRGLFLDAKNRLWVISGRKLLRIDAAGEKPTTIVDDGVFQYPHNVAVSDDGTAYVTDGYAKAIWKIAPGARAEKWASGEPFDNPVGIALHEQRWFVVDSRANAVFEIDASGKPTRRAWTLLK